MKDIIGRRVQQIHCHVGIPVNDVKRRHRDVYKTFPKVPTDFPNWHMTLYPTFVYILETDQVIPLTNIVNIELSPLEKEVEVYKTKNPGKAVA